MKKSLTLIVRRGALRRFDRLKRETAGLPVDVIWDRRTAQRRQTAGAMTPENRKSERRKAPSFVWETAGFLVTEQSGEEN